MIQESKHFRFWLAACLFGGGLLSLNLLFTGWINNLYSFGSFSILNSLTFVEQQYPVEFYIGRVADIWVGPITAVIGGLLFLSFAYIYLFNAGFWFFSICVFIYFLLTKIHVLYFPPYGDAIIGPFSDAMWLFRYNFDYQQYFQLENYSTGGPQTYPTSVYPSFLAYLLKITPNAQSFLVAAHLFTFSFSAITVAAFRQLCIKVYDAKFAFMASMCVLALPLYWAQTELINMETACTMFAVLAAWAVMERKFFWASICAILSLLIKAPGAMICVGVFAAAIIVFFFDPKHRWRFSVLLYTFFAVICAVIKGYYRKMLVGDDVAYNKVGLWVGWGNIEKMTSFWFFIVLLVLVLVLSLIRFIQKNKKFSFIKYVQAYINPIIMFMLVVVWFVLYLNFSVMIPRYQLLVVPFMMFCVVYTVHLLFKDQKIRISLFLTFFIFLYSNAHGWIYFDRGLDTINRHNKFERSLEYRNNLNLQMAIAHEIETYYYDWSVGAPLLLAQILNFHELGYLKNSPKDIIVYGMKSNHAGMRDFPGLQRLDLYKTIWIGFDGDQIADYRYPISPDDKIVKTIYRGNKKGHLFMGGIGIERYRRLFLIQNKLHKMLGR